MSRFTFPASPTVNQQAQLGARTFRWDGRAWRFIPPVIRFEDFLTQSQAQTLEQNIGTNVVQPVQDTVTALTQNAPTNLDTFAEIATAIDNDAAFATTIRSEIGAKADIVNGKIPAEQLPSFVDDVLEFSDLDDFPATGEQGKIYVALDSNKIYRWSGSAYIEISPGALPNDGTLTVNTGSGLTGSGTFTANQSADGTITLSHDATSSETSEDNSANEKYIKSLSIDAFGHVTTITSADVISGTVSLTLEGTLNSSNWTGTDPKVQTINVTGILASDNPIIDIVFSGQYNTDTARAIEFNKVYRIVTGDGTLTASAIEAPLVNLPLQIKVVR